jgi:RNA polymerase sigma-70 factor (ECF subfamily)
MQNEEATESSGMAKGSAPFAATQWTLVVQACGTRSPQAAAALEELCRRYWPPIYHYIRRQGCSAEDAQDLTQAFFENLLAKDYLRAADPSRGKFRSFLLACLRHFLSDARDRARAQKRGGSARHIPLEFAQAEAAWCSNFARDEDVGGVFDRSWAIAVLETARRSLKSYYVARGKRERHDALVGYLTGEDSKESYARAANELGLSEETVRTEVRRMRVRFRELLRQEVASTVSGPEEADREIRYLASII